MEENFHPNTITVGGGSILIAYIIYAINIGYVL